MRVFILLKQLLNIPSLGPESSITAHHPIWRHAERLKTRRILIFDLERSGKTPKSLVRVSSQKSKRMQNTNGMVPRPMAPPPVDPQQWMMAPQQQPAVWNQQGPMQPQPPVWGQQPQYAAAGAMQLSQQPASADEVRTLWIGDLQYWMDESYIHAIFAHTGEVVSVKIIRNKQTGQSEGYGFIEFANHASAERILQTYNGTQMPSVEQTFRLNWASFGGDKRQDESADFHIFVGDLASDVTDYMLQETFRNRYPSVKGAKVVIDRTTGRSKGYGFVRFGDETEQMRAMTEMNGMLCSTRQMRIGPAQNKKNVVSQQQFSTKASYQSYPASQSETDPNNTTIFVGNLDSNVTDEHLRQLFSSYGELLHVKIPVGKRCGFVQFANRSNAEEALLMLNGSQLGAQSIRLSWGRSPSNKQDASAGWAQPQTDSNQWNNSGYYGYGQSYDAYVYAPSQDPNMYAYGGGYPGYGSHQQQQQQ